MSTLAVDLGGTKLRVARINSDGRIGTMLVRQTGSDPAALDQLLREMGGNVTRAVVGVPGRVDHHHGRLDHAPNLDPAWGPALQEARLADVLGAPVHLCNDADLAAIGEASFGAGRGYDDLVFVTLSTGVGAGIILNRRLLRGRRSIGEVGHHVIDQGAFARGLPSTFEELASGTALGRTAARLGAPGTGEEVMERARAGDTLCRRALDIVVEAAAVGLRNLAYLYSPQAIVIGGGFGLALDPRRLEAHLRQFGPPAIDIAVRRADLGDSAGLVGAAAWHTMGA